MISAQTHSIFAKILPGVFSQETSLAILETKDMMEEAAHAVKKSASDVNAQAPKYTCHMVTPEK